MPCEQRAHPFNIISGQARARFRWAQRQVHDGDDGEQAHCEQDPGDEVGDPLGAEPKWSVDADQPLNDMRELGGQRMRTEQAASAHAQQGQPDHDRGCGEGQPDPQRPPAGCRITLGPEVAAGQYEPDEQRRGRDSLFEVEALDHMQDDARAEQCHHTEPGAALASAQTTGEQEQKEADYHRERGGLARCRSGQDLADHIQPVAPLGGDPGHDVDQPGDEHQGGGRGRYPWVVPGRQQRPCRA